MEKWCIYFQEALSQIAFAKHSYLEFEEALAENDTLKVFYRLHHFIVHVTNVDKLLDAKPDSIRAKIFGCHLDTVDVDLKLIRRLRNHLEHFDERLDVWVTNYDGHTFFDMNIVTGAKGFPEKAFLRALDGFIFKFYGESFPLKSMLESLDKLNLQLTSALKTK